MYAKKRDKSTTKEFVMSIEISTIRRRDKKNVTIGRRGQYIYMKQEVQQAPNKI
jgi:hypothetical protein